MAHSIEQFSQELRRGILTICVLKVLEQTHYGYSLKRKLLDLNLEIEENTLYPMLRRLEKQGYLSSSWQVEGNRPRKYYSINDSGRNLLNALLKEYNHITKTIDTILSKN